MKRGRKPTPSALKALKGNPGHRPLPENEPVASGELGAPPEHWQAPGRALWYELRGMIPDGVATASDRGAFELLVALFVQLRASPEALSPAMAAQIRCALGVFGLTPSDRARLSVPPPLREDDDPTAEFFDD